MTYHMNWRRMGVLTLAAGLIGSTACSDTGLRGAIDDSELQNPVVFPFAAIGTAREINDLAYGANGESFDMPTDNFLLASNLQSDFRVAIGDWRDRGESFYYEQAHEAAWAGYKILDLALNNFTEEEYLSNPAVARSWLNAALGERIQADISCEVVYQYGPFGGYNLGVLTEYSRSKGNNVTYDIGTIVGKDSVYQRAIYGFEQAIQIAQNAMDDSVPVTTVDPEYFDPVQVQTAAYGGLAQARLALASMGINSAANYAAADAAAAMVLIDFREEFPTDEDLRENPNFNISWNNDDVTVWAGTINGVEWGSQVTALGGQADPRSSWQECQNYVITNGDEDDILVEENIDSLSNSGCTKDGASSNINRSMEVSTIPRWLPDALEEQSFIEAVEGTDMKLIRAEVALVAGDLAAFTTFVNEVRNFYGVPPIVQPATAGALEYPNALDDAWSLLDREVLLNDWESYRRLAHMHRWNHPFITGNETLHPMYRDMMATSGHQRFSCLPIPTTECDTNTAIACPDLGGGGGE